MKILYLLKTSEGAKWAFLAAKKLKEQTSYELHVALPAGGCFVQRYKELGVSVHEMDFSMNPLLLYRNGKKLQKLCKELQPDWVHSWFAQTTLYSRLFLRNMPIQRVFQVPGPLHLENKILRKFDVFSSNEKDYWIGTSQAICNFYRQEKVKEDKISYATAPVDYSDYELHPEKHYLRNQLQIPKDKKIIGTVSYFYPPKWYLLQKRGLKGHEELIDAFRLLLKERQDVVLVIGGCTWGTDSSYEKQLHQYAQEKWGSSVIFTGHEKKVAAFLSDLDLFVYPSLSENMGGVFESLFFQIPTLSSNCGALGEIVVHGKTGYTVNPKDHVVFADTMNYLLNNPDKTNEMKKNGYYHVLDLFDLNKMAQSLIQFYEKNTPSPLLTTHSSRRLQETELLPF